MKLRCQVPSQALLARGLRDLAEVKEVPDPGEPQPSEHRHGSFSLGSRQAPADQHRESALESVRRMEPDRRAEQ